VLVAENHDDTRVMLQMLLAMHGFRVVECRDGEAAVAEAMRVFPDVVVLDGRLQRLDGLSVARALRQTARLSKVPIIFTSGQSVPDVAQSAFDAGCDAYLLKPVNLDELLTLVQRLAADPSRHEARH
jgi:CheY-like chemotaxis protein